MSIDVLPTTEAIKAFWKAVWSNSKQHNKNAQWVSGKRDRKNVIEQIGPTITGQEITDTLKSTGKWKNS